MLASERCIGAVIEIRLGARVRNYSTWYMYLKWVEKTSTTGSACRIQISRHDMALFERVYLFLLGSSRVHSDVAVTGSFHRTWTWCDLCWRKRCQCSEKTQTLQFQNDCFCLGQVKYLFFKWKWIDDDRRAGLLRRWRVWRGSKMHSLRHEQGRSKLFLVCFSIFKNMESFQINNSILIFLIRSAYLTWHEAWPIDSCEKWNAAFPLSEFLKKHPFSNFILNVRGSHQLLWARSRETCSSAQETLRAPGLQSRCHLLFPCMKYFCFRNHQSCLQREFSVL